MKRPVGIDLFAGAGGLSLGFEQAGFDVRAAVEIDPIHAVVHEFNFPQCAVIPRSVVGLSAAQVRIAAGLGNEPVDVVFGGPPCQGFSMIGHRSFEDPRNRLVLEFVRLVDELGAKYFVFENVKGLTVGKHRGFLDDLVRAFEARGYDVVLPWKVLNAAFFGVPQHRERLFLIGAKRGLPLPAYPAVTTYPADGAPRMDVERGPTVEDAIGDLPDADALEELNESDCAVTAQLGNPSDYASEMRVMEEGDWHYGYRRNWVSSVLTGSWRTEHTDISKARFAETAPGATEPISRFYKLRAEGLSNTLRAGTDGARGAFTSPRPIHYRYSRCVTVREMARLHGFPDWFRFHWTKWHGARQIGNAVPPPLGRAVAAMIIRALGAAPIQPTETLELGNESGLYMTVAEAAAALGVGAPQQKRDRQSGARKRKQHEIESERIAALQLLNA